MPYSDFGIWFEDIPDGPGYIYMFGNPIMPDLGKPLAERVIGTYDATVKDVSPGRRLRVFASLVESHTSGREVRPRHRPTYDNPAIHEGPEGATYGILFKMLQGHEAFANLPLQWGTYGDRPLIHEYAEDRAVMHKDPEMHPALQDLGWEIGSDIHDASYAFNDPDLYFPGVDEGIEPVSDEHVRLVMWAMQRELRRELRGPLGATTYVGRLPAVPLTDLPWRIQRALAERRRFRFLQYGITKERWAEGKWSLLDVAEDPEFIPRRWLRQ